MKIEVWACALGLVGLMPMD